MAETKHNPANKTRRTGFKKRDLTGWFIMLPTILLFAFFVWEPLIESIRLSLYTAKGIRLQEFVGLQNMQKF